MLRFVCDLQYLINQITIDRKSRYLLVYRAQAVHRRLDYSTIYCNMKALFNEFTIKLMVCSITQKKSKRNFNYQRRSLYNMYGIG